MAGELRSKSSQIQLRLSEATANIPLLSPRSPFNAREGRGREGGGGWREEARKEGRMGGRR